MGWWARSHVLPHVQFNSTLSGHHIKKIRTLLLTTAACVLLYFVAGACLLRFALDSLVLPRVALSANTTAPLFLRISGAGGNAMLVRRYGTPRVGLRRILPRPTWQHFFI